MDNLIYKRTKFDRDLNDDGGLWKLWLPQSLTQKAIQFAHDSPDACHGGYAKTLKRIKEWYYWPNMSSEIYAYVKKCDICATSNVHNQKMRPMMGKQIEVQRKFQHLYADFLGEYPSTAKGNKHIFVCIDQMTKLVSIKPMRKATSRNVCNYLEEELFPVYGVPESIFTDNAKQFTSKEFEKFLTDYGIKHMKPPYYSAQANASERVNREIIKSIRVFASENHEKWDIMLHKIIVALKSGYHQSIGVSPYYATFGQTMITHGASYELLKKLKAIEGGDI